MSLRGRATTTISVVVILLLLVSALTPWFRVSYEWQILSEYRSDARFSVEGFEIYVYVDEEVLTNELHQYNSSYYEPVGQLMGVQALLIYLAVGISLLSVISLHFRNIALRLVLGSLVTLVLFGLLMNIYMGMDSSFNESGASLAGSSDLLTIDGFSGSKDVSIFSISWGPMVGWWFGLVSTLLQSLSLLVTFLARSSPARR